MALVFTSSATRGKEHPDPDAPTGRVLAEHGMKAVDNLSSRFTRVRLARDIRPDETTIATVPAYPGEKEACPPADTLTIEGERIA